MTEEIAEYIKLKEEAQKAIERLRIEKEEIMKLKKSILIF